MTENLPGLSGDPNVLLAAIAKAAAAMAAQDAVRRQDAAPLDRDAVEEIAEECIRAAFLRFGVDISDLKSVRAFNDTIQHAERSKGFWDKAGATALTGVVMAIVGIIIAALGKYGWPAK